MNKEEIMSLIKWWRQIDHQGIPIMEYFLEPVMKELGDDKDEILSFLNEMELEDLAEISGCFEELYKKFMTDEMYDFLEELEGKIYIS